MIHRPNLYLAQNISKRILKKEHTTSSGTGKIQPPRHLAKLSIWRGRLAIFDIDPQLNYIIRMHLKVIKSQQCSVERSHVVLKLILNSDQGLALIVTKIYTKKSKFIYSITLYPWLHLTNNNFPAFISIEEILDQTIFLNPHTRMDFKHPTQKYFKFTIIRDLCRFLQQV